MLYAGIKPIEEYDEFIPEAGRKFGLYSEYGHHPELMALVMIATPLPYDYEGSKPIMERACRLNKIPAYLEALKFEIAGQSLGVALRTMNPVEFSKRLHMADLSKMPFVSEVFMGLPDLLMGIVGARAAAWAQAYRGEVETVGKVVRASFGGRKSMFEIPWADQMLNSKLKGGVTNG